jgi:hypothetical protein
MDPIVRSLQARRCRHSHVKFFRTLSLWSVGHWPAKVGVGIMEQTIYVEQNAQIKLPAATATLFIDAFSVDW